MKKKPKKEDDPEQVEKETPAKKARRRVRKAVLEEKEKSAAKEFDLELLEEIEDDSVDARDEKVERAVEMYLDGFMDMVDGFQLSSVEDGAKFAGGIEKVMKAGTAFVLLIANKYTKGFEYIEEVGAGLSLVTVWAGGRYANYVASRNNPRPAGRRENNASASANRDEQGKGSSR